MNPAFFFVFSRAQFGLPPKLHLSDSSPSRPQIILICFTASNLYWLIESTGKRPHLPSFGVPFSQEADLWVKGQYALISNGASHRDFCTWIMNQVKTSLLPSEAFHVLIISISGQAWPPFSPGFLGKAWLIILEQLVNCYLIAIICLPSHCHRSLEHTPDILNVNTGSEMYSLLSVAAHGIFGF